MFASNVVASFLIAIIIGNVTGVTFTLFVEDRRVHLRRNLLLGVLSAIAGWLFGMMIPSQQHQLVAADFISFGTSGLFLHLYWVTFHERTNLMKDFDAQSPLNPRQEKWRP